jgi:hypothetical protein
MKCMIPYEHFGWKILGGKGVDGILGRGFGMGLSASK